MLYYLNVSRQKLFFFQSTARKKNEKVFSSPQPTSARASTSATDSSYTPAASGSASASSSTTTDNVRPQSSSEGPEHPDAVDIPSMEEDLNNSIKIIETIQKNLEENVSYCIL